jgi:hypothetical protein
MRTGEGWSPVRDEVCVTAKGTRLWARCRKRLDGTQSDNSRDEIDRKTRIEDDAIVKKLRDLSERLKDADFKMLLADLQGELADAKLEVVALKERVAALSTKNAEMSALLEARSAEEPEPMDGGYKFGNKGPYCAGCFEKQGKKVLLPPATGIHSHFGQWHCPVCDNPS